MITINPGAPGVDQTPTINTALATAFSTGQTVFFSAGNYPIGEASAGAGYCLLNQGVNMIGDGRLGVTFTPLSSVGSSVDLMKVRPPSGAYIDFLLLSRLTFQPNGHGKRAIYFSFDQATNAQNLVLEYLYCAPGNDHSIHFYNDPTINPQGVPFAGKILGGYYAEGILVENCADSFTLTECPILRTSTGSGRWCFEYTGVAGADGIPAGLLVDGLNADGDGGAILLHNGRYPSLQALDIEQSRGGYNGFAIDLRGDQSPIISPKLDGVAIGAFGTASLTGLVRFCNTKGGIIDNYALISAPTGSGFTAPTNGITVIANATDACVGSTGEISSNFSAAVGDTGYGTRGVLQYLSLVSGFTNVSPSAGFTQATFKKSPAGRVQLDGVVNCPTNPSGLTLATLPNYFRPPTAMRYPVLCQDVGGNNLLGSIVIFNTGVVQFAGPNTANQIFLSNVGFDSVAYIIGNS